MSFSLKEILKNTLYVNRRSETGQALKSTEMSKYVYDKSKQTLTIKTIKLTACGIKKENT